MFVYYFVHIGRPFDVVESTLLRMLPGLRGWATQAYRDGEHLRARIASGPRKHAMAKSVEIAIGTPVRGSAETWIPLAWEATGLPGLFPRMEADVVIARVGDNLTQVALRGSYTPPLGAVGRAADRALLHRVAEASVKAFLDRIAAEFPDERSTPEEERSEPDAASLHAGR